MKKSLLFALPFTVAAFFSSCEKDEGKLPAISFKTGGSYTSTDALLVGGTAFTIGINASKTEDKDVLKKINVSKSVNGATSSIIFSKDLSGSESDNYAYDYSATLDTNKGQTNKYTFTITNRDGLTNQAALTITVK